MHIERLKHLIDILQCVPPEQFDLGFWECGTTACAVGWACRDPQFQSQGLKPAGFIYLDGGRSYSTSPTYDLQDGTAPMKSWEAVKAFFGLTLNQALHLFSLEYYEAGDNPTTADVIARIEELLAREVAA